MRQMGARDTIGVWVVPRVRPGLKGSAMTSDALTDADPLLTRTEVATREIQRPCVSIRGDSEAVALRSTELTWHRQVIVA